MVGASCITVSACDICTQRSTVLTVIVCHTHFAVCTFQTSTASTADRGACIALLAANGTNFYAISTAAVADSDKLAVRALTAYLALVAVFTEIIAAGTTLVTITADLYTVLTGVALTAENIVVFAAFSTLFPETCTSTTLFTSAAFPAEKLLNTASGALLFVYCIGVVIVIVIIFTIVITAVIVAVVISATS